MELTYSQKLNATKADYPFEKWLENGPNEGNDFDGMEQYTPENCDKAKQIFEDLIAELIEIDEKAPNKQKEKLFEKAVLALNKLNDEIDDGFIETGEREDLCDLIDQITVACGLDPEDYSDGEGIAGQWREW